MFLKGVKIYKKNFKLNQTLFSRSTVKINIF